MKRTKKIISIVIMTMVIFIIAGCSLGKGRSGKYTMTEFHKLVEPAQTAFSDAIDEALDSDLEGDDFYNAVYGAYTNALKSAGFKGGETITVTGDFEMASVFSDEVDVSLSDGNAAWLDFSVDPEKYAWAVVLNRGEEMELRFQIEKTEEGFLKFGPADILSPSKPEYQDDCTNVANETDSIVFGEITNIYTFSLTNEEIEDAKNNATGNALRWYEAMMYADYFIIIQDEAGNQVGAFVNTYGKDDLDFGQKVGCAGTGYRINEEDLPEFFIDCTYWGGYYIFED